ncbi:SHOCT domain-containing protein [Desulfonema magnum]|nr:SHOCT domain-containing protein [Desulfonema magnum]
MTKKNNYIKQTDIMSNLGLFYIILIAFFTVPLLGAFVVVLIKGLVDLKYVIIIGGGLLLTIALYALIRFLIRLFRKIRHDGFMTGQEIKKKASRGEPVQISVFNGLLTFTYGGRQGNITPLLPAQENQGNLALPPSGIAEKQSQTRDVVTRLTELSDLRDQGVVTEDEFHLIKKRLIRDADDSED